MLIEFLVAFVAALVLSGVIALYTPRRWRRYPEYAPQRFHRGEVPRLGGLAIGIVFWTVGWFWSDIHAPVGHGIDPSRWWVNLGLALLPLWLGGLLEDATGQVQPRWRLALTIASAAVATSVLGLSVTRTDLPWLDQWLIAWPWLGWGIAILAVAAMPHAINFIDGYNGLASTVVLMIAGGLFYVAIKLGDWRLAGLLMALLGATAGFWFWNYPRGLLFAGDGGAYLWGAVVAIACLDLVRNHPEVSPWFPVLLLAYPIMEAVFSIYRKMARGQSPTVADALHFHQLVYRRLVRGVVHDDHARKLLMRNNRTSPYLWGVALLAVMPAIIFWNKTWLLMVLSVLFVILYVAAYVALVRFRIPRWMRNGKRS